jgi:hypothetical protein
LICRARRDEFSLDFRTEQYREQLKMEDKYGKRALQLLRAQAAAGSGARDGTGDGAALDTAGAFKFGMTEGLDKPFLYDLVFEKEDTAHTGASKVHRCAGVPDAVIPVGVPCTHMIELAKRC